MSGPARADRYEDLILDPEVLRPEPIFEVGGYSAVSEVGGQALIFWRSDYLRAGTDLSSNFIQTPPHPASFTQAVVRVSKGRVANEVAISLAWNALQLHGRLLVHGTNELGIVSLGKRLAEIIQQQPTILVNRARARVLCFNRSDHVLPTPEPRQVPLDVDHSDMLLVEPGVFSSDGLDDGTNLLQIYMTSMTTRNDPQTIIDIGCGAGHLAFSALRRWPHAAAILLDADYRAVRSAQLNVKRLGFEQRAQCQWWDASEEIAAASADLVLINPPFHAGTATDYQTARRMFQVAATALKPQGQVLIVANRQLPYEADLSQLGQVGVVEQRGGFKLISLVCH